MYRVKLQAVPDSGSDAYGEIGGTYVVCYLPVSSAEIALREATEYLTSEKWVVLQVEEAPAEILEEQESISREERDHCREAREAGGCYIFHTYPVGPDEDDTIH